MEIFNTKWKVLILIFKYPTKGLSIQKLSRLCGVSHTLVIKIVHILEEREIINVKKIGKSHIITGNFENEEFVELKRLHNILSLKPLVQIW